MDEIEINFSSIFSEIGFIEDSDEEISQFIKFRINRKIQSENKENQCSECGEKKSKEENRIE